VQLEPEAGEWVACGFDKILSVFSFQAAVSLRVDAD
jgi:hypothetical protein